jgi:hypothetical protein
MVTWPDMPEFNGIDLSESYVLGWSTGGGELRFELDAVLTPAHPKYSIPPPHEWACYRRATLVFPEVTLIRGLASLDDVRASVDAAGELDYGNIDTLEALEHGYRIVGDFGDVLVESSAPRLALRE